MKSWARSRAAKLSKEKRQKAICCVCGDFIYNRMHYKWYGPTSLVPASEQKNEYAHQVCARKDEDKCVADNRYMGYVWERCW